MTGPAENLDSQPTFASLSQPGWLARGEHAAYACPMQTFDGFVVEVESFDRATGMARVRSAIGTFSAAWMGNDPLPGETSGVEFSTEPTAVWGTDVTDASPVEPDAIIDDADGWTFVGTILGVVPGEPGYSDAGRDIPQHDLEDGVIHLRIGNCVLWFVADVLPADAAGSRVRVRQTEVQLYPQ
jgi:hypothetical protein